MNAYTSGRKENGCGQINDVEETKPCQSIGINTAEQWLEKYSATKAPNGFICGFTLEGYADAEKKKYFSVNTEIQKKLLAMPDFINPWSEILADNWPTDTPSKVPVMAFFYVQDGSLSSLIQKNSNKTIKLLSESESKSLAQTHQLTYYQTTGIFAPLVKISGSGKMVKFSYVDNDQASDIPTESLKIYPD